ncbi:hypothetical protein [Pseudomonas kilonensis]|uniref:hypothetical protein n=1 Tax=Pseudomonas kilonensis TaxID=132476 RepID=UPI000ADC6710|nr:hypothetical protein [Pseudomonas kilonensis]
MNHIPLIVLGLLVAGCTAGSGFSERDRNVINTPDYFDNRVFYVSPNKENDVYKLSRSDTLSPDESSDISHGSPISVILDSVTLPRADSSRTMDIAIVIEVGASDNGTSTPIVAWYQRGVNPDQALNFSNLLLYFEPRWDARIAPLFHIRVIDVYAEKNQEARDALAQVSQLSQSLSPIASGVNQAAFSLGVKAAGLILSNRDNRQLLDYTVQFYSSETINNSYGSDLTPLRRGRFILLSRPIDKISTSSYWNAFSGTFDPASKNVISQGQVVASPTVTVTVSTAQTIVPVLVSSRSLYLQSLLSDSQQKNAASIESAAASVLGAAKTYSSIDRLRRLRTKRSLEQVIALEKDQAAATKVSDDDKAMIRATLSELTGCHLDSSDKVTLWADANPEPEFEERKFRLKGGVCG